MNQGNNNCDPLVSIMMPTYNRRRYLTGAIESALRQDYPNFEIILIRDGGDEISDIVNHFDDHRIKFIDRHQNMGKAHSLNEGLASAKGKYICYLDDDDEYYPNHLRTLVDILEDGEKYQVAYSDLYKAHCRVEADGSRTILAKNIEITRDFDRMFMLHFNTALHVSLMHRKDLLEKTGSYNENLRILIDWDFTRRAAFYADFKHTHTITGQFYGPVGDCDRISVKNRKDTADYIKNVLEIRTTRPAKPWSKLKDLSIIMITDTADENLGKSLRDIWLKTFYPYTLYLPMPAEQLDRINSQMPCLVKCPVGKNLQPHQKIASIIDRCQSELVAIAHWDYPIHEAWIERGVNPFVINPNLNDAIELEQSTDMKFSAVMPTDVLRLALQNYPDMPLKNAIALTGFNVRKADVDEYCFVFDSHLCAAKDAQAEGDWVKAAHMYDIIRQDFGNDLWMDTMCSNALFMAGHYEKANEIITKVNNQRPTVSTLMLQGKIYNKLNNSLKAIELLDTARNLIEGKTTVWTH